MILPQGNIRVLTSTLARGESAALVVLVFLGGGGRERGGTFSTRVCAHTKLQDRFQRLLGAVCTSTDVAVEHTTAIAITFVRTAATFAACSIIACVRETLPSMRRLRGKSCRGQKAVPPPGGPAKAAVVRRSSRLLVLRWCCVRDCRCQRDCVLPRRMQPSRAPLARESWYILEIPPGAHTG